MMIDREEAARMLEESGTLEKIRLEQEARRKRVSSFNYKKNREKKKAGKTIDEELPETEGLEEIETSDEDPAGKTMVDDTWVKIVMMYHSGSKSKMDLAKNMCYEQTKKLVESIAYKYYYSLAAKDSFDDIKQEGHLAVTSELPIYNPLGSRPDNFFGTRIQHAMRLATYKTTGTPQYVGELSQRISRAEEEIKKITGDEYVSDRAISTFTKIPIKTIQTIRNAVKIVHAVPLEDYLATEDNGEVPDGHIGEDPQDALERKEKSVLIANALKKLSENDRFIICATFGIGMEPISSDAEIGKMVGMTGERVSARVNNILNMLHGNRELEHCYNGEPLRTVVTSGTSNTFDININIRTAKDLFRDDDDEEDKIFSVNVKRV